jgi:hypothetical protein
MLDADPNLLATHPGQTLMADKNYYGRNSKPRSPTPGHIVVGQSSNTPPR